MLALIVFQFANTWGFTFLVNSAPKYVREVLGFTIANTGLLATLPYACRMLGAFLFAAINDFIQTQHPTWMSKMARRRMFSVCCTDVNPMK